MEKEFLSDPRERKGHGEKYSRKDLEAIDALITEPTIAAAAKKAGISERTLRHWLQKPDFQERYHDERMHRLEAATRGLEEVATKATERVGELFNHSCIPSGLLSYTRDPKDCVRAAKVVFDALFKKMQLYQVERRLNVLERKVAAGEEESGDDAGENLYHRADESTVDASPPVLVSRESGHTPCARDKVRHKIKFSAPVERCGDAELTEEGRVVRQGKQREDNGNGAHKAATLGETAPSASDPQMTADDRKVRRGHEAGHGTSDNETAHGDCRPPAPSEPMATEGTAVPASGPQKTSDGMERILRLLEKKKQLSEV